MKHKICLTLMMCALTSGMNVTSSSAESIYLEAPPLLWEEQPETKKADDSEYWERKYGIVPKKQEKETNKKAVPDKDDLPEAKLEPTGREVKSEEAEAADTAKSEAKEDTTEKNTSVVIAEQEEKPHCDFADVVGENVAKLDFTVFEGRPVRVVYPNQMITMDIIPNRVNIKVTPEGTVTKVSCF